MPNDDTIKDLDELNEKVSLCQEMLLSSHSKGLELENDVFQQQAELIKKFLQNLSDDANANK